MTRARASAILAIVLSVSAAGCAPRATAAIVPVPTVPHECDGVADTVQVLATAEVRAASLRRFLDDAPLGPCAAARVTRIPVAQARDALDRGTPMLVTSDPATLDYAAARDDLRSTALAWDVAYLLVVRDADAATIAADTVALDALRAELARDVVRGDARPSTDSACGAVPADAMHHAHRVGYPLGDGTARSIAARLVAVAPMGPGLRVAAVQTADDTSAMAVLSRAPGVVEPCPADRLLVPLVETRARAIVPAESP